MNQHKNRQVVYEGVSLETAGGFSINVTKNGQAWEVAPKTSFHPDELKSAEKANRKLDELIDA